MNAKPYLPLAQVGLLSLVGISIYVAVANVTSTWSTFGFGSIPVLTLTALAFVAFLVGFKDTTRLGKIGAIGFAVTLAFGTYLGPVLQNNPGQGFLVYVGFATSLALPSAYFIWLYGSVQKLANPQLASLGLAIMGFILWGLTFIWPGSMPMSDSDMGNVVVCAGLFLANGVVGLVAFLLQRAKRK